MSAPPARGSRVLLKKIGLKRSYVIVNTFLYPVNGQFDATLKRISLEPWLLDFRNATLDLILAESPLEAIIAMGSGAQHTVNYWPGKGSLPGVMVGGKALYGNQAGMEKLRTDDCEALLVNGSQKQICVSALSDSVPGSGQTLHDIQTVLRARYQHLAPLTP